MQNLIWPNAESDLFTRRRLSSSAMTTTSLPPLEPLCLVEEDTIAHPKRKFIRKWRDQYYSQENQSDDDRLCHLAKGNT